jgi:hypothetical protein
LSFKKKKTQTNKSNASYKFSSFLGKEGSDCDLLGCERPTRNLTRGYNVSEEHVAPTFMANCEDMIRKYIDGH